MNNKTKEINWFWKNWTEDEKRIYKQCATFTVMCILFMLMFSFFFANQFHATDAPPQYDDKDAEIRGDWGQAIPGYHYETRWDDEKGEWYGVYVPDATDIFEYFPGYGDGGYSIDVNGAGYIFRRMFNIIYTAILPFTSILAATLASYNICLVMTSKNQRKIEESYTHIKVIGKVWLCIMLSGVFITLAVQGFTALVNNPAAQPILHP